MANNRLTRAAALILALVMILSLLAVPGFADPADEAVVIKLHYHRPDGDYTDWSVWFWNFGQDGVDVPFAEEDGDMVATFQVGTGTTQVGFIVKLPNWAQKDVNMDQFIDVAPYLSGTVHVYVESGIEGYELVLGDDIVSGIKLTGAVYKENVGIQVTMTYPIDNADTAFSVTGPDGNVPITGVTANGSVYTLTTEAPLDLYSSYTLTYNGENYAVSMPNVYSTEAFEAQFTYEGKDLGATWTADKTTFRVWAPTADAVQVNLYQSGTHGTDDLIEVLDMTADVNGTWVAEKAGDLNGVYYTYSVTVDGSVNEACDPYARATGVNGKRAMVIDLDSTDPAGWENDTDPHAGQNITDAVIYELHVRDLSMDESSGITNKGKYLGLIETGTTNANGIPTGLDHIKDMGITHLHLLPVYDFGSVDESRPDVPQFNWGYDPVNYNVPEGSYSTDPYNGEVRVKEFKQMVNRLHDNGIQVIMDVVYNHVYSGEEFCFNKIVPLFFSRVSAEGVFSAGSACGNDTASERAMVRKYIVDSVKYWADEYHIDGFRWDLVGLIDTETIQEVMEEVHKTHPHVIFYGEGWTMATQLTKDGYTLTTQVNSQEVPGFAFFSDTLRDAIRGGNSNNSKPGFVAGSGGFAGNISDCFIGAPAWCKSPSQSINYASCHDNHTLFDRITMATPKNTFAERVRMNNLAAAIVLTSQGVPFLHAGEEMLRSKPLEDGTFDHNSYRSSDAVNNLKWANLNQEEYALTNRYYQGLIAFRKAHPALRMTTAAEVSEKITKLGGLDFNVVGFHIAAGANGEENELIVVFNPNAQETTVELPEGNWTICISGDQAGTASLGNASGTALVEPISTLVLVKAADISQEPMTDNTDSEEHSIGIIGGADGPTAIFVTGNWISTLLLIAGGICGLIAVIVVLKKRRK